MLRGFVSFLFFMLVTPLLLLVIPSPSLDLASTSAPRILSLRRAEMELNVDAIIREELFSYAHSNLPEDTIKLRINVRVLDYLSQFSRSHEDVFSESGFSTLYQPNYLSLLSTPLTPPSLLELQSSSHVLVLPVSQTERYLEYSYTGGLSASRVLNARLRVLDSNSLFALPVGYCVCVTSFELAWPCVGS